MYILGINCFGHDASAALIHDGRIIAAAEEERFSRKKHDGWLPALAIQYCLQEGGVDAADISQIAYYWNPWIEPQQIIRHVLRYFPKSLQLFRGASLHYPFLKRYPCMVRLRHLLRKVFPFRSNVSVVYVDHHHAHAASFFLSPFAAANVLVVDGIGEWSTSSFYVGQGNRLTLLRNIQFPHSLGFLYSAITHHLGFQPNSDEWKVMALASYGDPQVLREAFADLVHLETDGTFQLNLHYFDYHLRGAQRWVSDRFVRCFGAARVRDTSLTPHHMNIAAALQSRFEEAMSHMVQALCVESGLPDLVLTGGCALNCVANAKLQVRGGVGQTYVPFSPADSGTSIGAALYLYHHLLDRVRVPATASPYLGPAYSDAAIEQAVALAGLSWERIDDIYAETARRLEEGQIGGWFQGRMEFGPRALGNRSIIADPRVAQMRDIINAKVKFRESFRPLAPSVTVEAQTQFFAGDMQSPYMSFAPLSTVIGRQRIPATIHVDHTARLQSVSQSMNERWWRLLKAFESRTGIPVILNTSFNVQGEPIVCSPTDALRCFHHASLDFLVLGDYLIARGAN
ncbi:MAG: carbamoyl transferase [Deltaproteobacteria bacterium]|nr:carbamoyl transferase [Deltaproteobacteria bacterium]